MKHIADKVVSDAKAEHVNLQDNDLLHLKNGNLEIYVRRVPAPPKVKLAPFFRRDKDLKKYLLLMLFIMVIPLAGLNFLQVDEEKQKEKDPERIVRILYKQKLEVSKNKAVEKTPDKPKVAQTTPAKVVEKKVEPKKPTPVVAKPTPTPAKQDPGKKVETQPEPVKKAVAPTPVPTTTVAPPAKVVGAQTPVAKPAPTAKAVTDVKAAGVVDVYKSADFKSSLSSLMAKGGSVSGVKTTADTTAIGGANIGGSTSSDLKKADVASDVGSLTGAAVGKLGENKGAEGLSAKTGILTAGIPAETVVLGSMDPDVIRRILRDHLPQFRSCYQRELDRSAGQKVDGVIPIIFTIGASGSVSAAAVSGASQLSSGVKGCVVNVIKGIQFPRPQGGGTVEVKQPLNFQSSTLR
jgi:outer membrane biosynthesis protein TonB